MNNWVHMLKEFHKACETEDPIKPTIPPQEKIELRRKLIKEEYTELCGDEITEIGAMDTTDLEEIAKELCDLIYVVIGTALAYGIDLDRAFCEVHRSNMTKFPNGRVIRRADGKILKPETYEFPNMGVIWDDPVPQI